MNLGSIPVDGELVVALLAVAVSWGSLNQRIKAVEAHAPKLENLGRLEERLDRLGQDVRELAQAVRDFMRNGR